MDLNNTELVSTEVYSLSEIFTTDHRKIIIPDFQRDYCWGDKTHGEKNDTDIVSNFMETIMDEYRTGETLLGKIDVYENPKGHINITDGQQRLTSLYLLIGMLYRLSYDDTTKQNLKRCLISDFEEKDDMEPYLQYSIRESSVFFLRDLVNDFFIQGNGLNVSDIEKQSWYFEEYKLDPTINSIISALTSIEKMLKTRKDNLDLSLFSEFIINRVKIQYFNVVDRKHGEERFVIINTTGKSLTVTENLKPILLGTVNDPIYSDQWEERETWFWQNRNKEKEQIADDGVKEFLTWCFQITDNVEYIDLIKRSKYLNKKGSSEEMLSNIDKYFRSLNQLIDFLASPNIQQQFKFINDGKEVRGILDLRALKNNQNQNIVLPLLAFTAKISKNELDVYHFLRRLRKNYFDIKWVDRNHNYVDWRYILKIIDQSNSLEEILHFNSIDGLKPIEKINLNQWYNEEERIKNVFKNEIHSKQSIEEFEDHPDFMGDISTLFNIYLVDESSESIPKLDQNTEKFSPEVFPELKKYYQNYFRLESLMSENNGHKEPNLSNYYRLFKVITNCNKIDRIPRTSGMKGVQFSTPNRNQLQHLNSLKLFRTKNLLEFLKAKIHEKLINDKIFIINENYSSHKLLKAWLSLKIFTAEKEDELVSYLIGGAYNNTGIAVYDNKYENLIFEQGGFCIENCICSFAYKSAGFDSYISYVPEEKRLKIHCLNTPFAGITYEMFKTREKLRELSIVEKEALEKNRKHIIETLASNHIILEDN